MILFFATLFAIVGASSATNDEIAKCDFKTGASISFGVNLGCLCRDAQGKDLCVVGFDSMRNVGGGRGGHPIYAYSVRQVLNVTLQGNSYASLCELFLNNDTWVTYDALRKLGCSEDARGFCQRPRGTTTIVTTSSSTQPIDLNVTLTTTTTTPQQPTSTSTTEFRWPTTVSIEQSNFFQCCREEGCSECRLFDCSKCATGWLNATDYLGYSWNGSCFRDDQMNRTKIPTTLATTMMPSLAAAAATTRSTVLIYCLFSALVAIASVLD